MSTVTAGSAPERVRAARLEKRRSHRLVLFGLAMGNFMLLLDMTVLSVAEPDLAHSLDSSTADLQWVVSGYTVTFGAFLLLAGALADHLGAHRVFRAGVIGFGAASLLCALAPSVGSLAVARGLLGVAAAACVPASMGIIARMYSRPAERARAVALWAATSGTALAAGPLIGGLLVELAGWRLVFVVNVPIAIATIAVVAGPAIACPRLRRPVRWPAHLAACAGLVLLTNAIIVGGAGDVATALVSAGASAIVCGLLVQRGRGRSGPLITPGVAGAPGVRSALVAGAVVNFSLAGMLFVLPFHLQRSLGLTAVETGVALLPMTIPLAANPLLAGRAVAATGPRRPLLVGLVSLAAGAAVIAEAVRAEHPYPVVLVGLVGVGIGVSTAVPALIAMVIGAVPQGTEGAAGGLLFAARQVGATFGVAVLGAFVTTGGAEPGRLALALTITVVLSVAATLAVGAAGWSRRRPAHARGCGRRRESRPRFAPATVSGTWSAATPTET